MERDYITLMCNNIIECKYKLDCYSKTSLMMLLWETVYTIGYATLVEGHRRYCAFKWVDKGELTLIYINIVKCKYMLECDGNTLLMLLLWETV